MNLYNLKFDSVDFSTVKQICSLGATETSNNIGQIGGSYACLGHGLVGSRDYFVAIGTSLPNEIGQIVISHDGKTWYSNNETMPLEGVTSSYRKIVFYKSLAILQAGEKILIITNFKISGSSLKIIMSKPIALTGKPKDIEVIGEYLYILTDTAVSKYTIDVTETNKVQISHVKDYGFLAILPPEKFAKSSETLIAYMNTDSLPVFYRINDETDALENFTNMHAFKINSAIVIDNKLILYSEDKNIYDIDLSDKSKINSNCIVNHTNIQWMGNPLYYNGYIYNAFYNISSNNGVAEEPYVSIVMGPDGHQLASSVCTLPCTKLINVDISMNESTFCFLVGGDLFITHPSTACNRYRNWDIISIDIEKDLINVNVDNNSVHSEYKIPIGNYDNDILELRFMQGSGMKQFLSNTENGIDRYFIKDSILHIITNENFDDITPYDLVLIRSRVKR